ncbi:hypothetical protein Nepgr_003995 [Nepenthes gracilis]|uniref:Uncharacterized protein n=1 Tax=Nepenthes gracilis TaxID=150966 RepID=A0AAD3S0I6_NEPGR|nr:hypothetical protein Nepgr_003995 [Nepenthes gracilis]
MGLYFLQGWGHDEADLDLWPRLVFCLWSYGVFLHYLIIFDLRSYQCDAVRIAEFLVFCCGILLKAFWMMILCCCNGYNVFGGALCLELVRAAVEYCPSHG